MDTQENNKFYIVQDEDKVVLKVSPEGEILLWDEEGFLELCELNKEEPIFQMLLAVFNLGAMSV